MQKKSRERVVGKSFAGRGFERRYLPSPLAFLIPFSKLDFFDRFSFFYSDVRNDMEINSLPDLTSIFLFFLLFLFAEFSLHFVVMWKFKLTGEVVHRVKPVPRTHFKKGKGNFSKAVCPHKTIVKSTLLVMKGGRALLFSPLHKGRRRECFHSTSPFCIRHRTREGWEKAPEAGLDPMCICFQVPEQTGGGGAKKTLL